MPGSAVSIRVAGYVSADTSHVMLVLAERLEGYDTFLTGRLEVDGCSNGPVRILTLDDVTVLRVADWQIDLAPGGHWSGTLHLPHGLRSQEVPDDLASAAASRRRDLTALDEAERRYALTFLQEATTSIIRRGRIAAIVNALPAVNRPTNDPSLLISVDVGGTLGYSTGQGLIVRLAQLSPLPAVEARRVARHQLHTVPEISEAVIADVCAALKIPLAMFPRKLLETGFRLAPNAMTVIRELSYYGIVVTLSNVICLETNDLDWHTLFSPWLSDYFASCHIGYSKPDPRAFQTVASAYGMDTSHMLHIGDDWECDIIGAVSAGAHAVWLSGGRPIPDTGLIERGVVLVADQLDQVPAQVAKLARRHS